VKNTQTKKLRVPIELHLWQKSKGQTHQKIKADSACYFLLPEMKIKVAVQKQNLIFVDAVTNKVCLYIPTNLTGFKNLLSLKPKTGNYQYGKQ